MHKDILENCHFLLIKELVLWYDFVSDPFFFFTNVFPTDIISLGGCLQLICQDAMTRVY